MIYNYRKLALRLLQSKPFIAAPTPIICQDGALMHIGLHHCDLITVDMDTNDYINFAIRFLFSYQPAVWQWKFKYQFQCVKTDNHFCNQSPNGWWSVHNLNVNLMMIDDIGIENVLIACLQADDLQFHFVMSCCMVVSYLLTVKSCCG